MGSNRNVTPRIVWQSCAAMLSVWVCAVSTAQQASQAEAAASEEGGETLGEVVVTGTRRSDRTVEKSPTPIDVISGDSLQQQGFSSLNDALRTEVVSLNVQRFVAQDGAAFIRPFSLRGLPSDQTLVLVNGKRRHRSALVQITNQPLSAGAQGADLATIPAIAVKQIEVLRDGAAAQYGSDAIAGVINFRLQDASDGLTFVTRAGRYYEGDGDDLDVQVNAGFPLTADGFFNLSAEYASADPTSRGIQRPDAQALIDAGNTAVPVPAQIWGNVDTKAVRVFFNAEVPATEAIAAYAFGNYSSSDGRSPFFYRNPVTRLDVFRSVPLTSQPGGPRFSFTSWFPGGFAPEFGTDITDLSLTAGFKGESDSGLGFDVSAGTGRSEIEYSLSNTVNPSLGPASPTSFKPGTIEQVENRLNVDFSYPWKTSWFASPLNIAFGAEAREEKFEIRNGDRASWEAGPFARVLDPDSGAFVGLAVGSSGFPGYTPETAGEFSRSNWAVYTDLETDVTERLTLGIATRYEDFSDFGDTFNWKVSGRFAFNDAVALRASVNTGFRAPTPGQSNISDVATNIDPLTGGLLLVATLPPTNAISQFYGARALAPEKSFNVAGGLVFNFRGYLLTVDYFDIDVDDRLGLTSRITITAADRASLLAQGIDPGQFQSVRFLGNFFDSNTRGIDVVLTKSWSFGSGSELGLTLAGNRTRNEAKNIRNALAVSREREIEIREFNPEIRANVSVDYELGRWGLLVRGNYYGEWTDAVANAAPTPVSFDQTFPEEWLLDVETRFAVTDRLSLTLGAENVLDAYPAKDQRLSQINNGIVYPQFSPFGFSGGFYYLRATAKF